MNKIYLIFAGGHAKQVIDIFIENQYEICGIFDDFKENDFYRNTKIIGKISDIDKFSKNKIPFFCTIGDNLIREKIYNEYNNLEWVNCISQRAYISPSVKLGVGNYIGTFCKILADSIIGDFNIINEGSTLTHDNIIGNFNHIAPNSSLGGKVNIRNRNLIGTNSTINPNISIFDNIIIGSGAVVIKNISDPGTFIGVPCKKIK